MKQLFLDLDGVFADFDSMVSLLFGFRPNRDEPEPEGFWKTIERHGSFFADMPMLPGAQYLWHSFRQLHPNPIILTGVPHMRSAESQKRFWVRKNLGDANVICCRSKDKRDYSKPGDILVDDWTKYQKAWEEFGGTFVLHMAGTTNSLSAVARLLNE